MDSIGITGNPGTDWTIPNNYLWDINQDGVIDETDYEAGILFDTFTGPRIQS